MSKNVLITGCSSGFGFDAAVRFARKGHNVFATMRNPQGRKPAEDLKAIAESEGVKITVLDMDVTSDESVNAAAAQLPTIDVLINNAGLGYGGPVEAFTSQQIIDQLNLNVVGTIRAAKAVLPRMRAQGSGLIIQVSSTAGRAAFPGFGVYHASKWGLEAISESLRYEVSQHGVDVVIVEPGPFATAFLANMVQASDESIAAEYPHLGPFWENFESIVQGAFADEAAPTDPSIVIDIFEELVDMPTGTRPFRTIAGMDFGLQAVNDVTEPIRQSTLEMMQISDWDGPKASA